LEIYVVIRLQGKQYRVTEADEILVDKITDLKKIEPEVLLFADDGKVKVGKPVLKDVKIKIKILSLWKCGKRRR